MIDPHGEYSAAFKGTGALFDVDNLAMPYWLMNFEEHYEVFVTAEGRDRQADCDALARCLLPARRQHRRAEGMTKMPVDTPIPYNSEERRGGKECVRPLKFWWSQFKKKKTRN